MHRTPVSIMPHMAHITFAILALHLGNTTYRHGFKPRQILADSFIYIACMALLRQTPPRETWAFCLALGHCVWNLLPGSFGSSFDLPSHATFLRNLHIRDQPGGECMICWDDTSLLANLPCNHQSCKDCLQHMGSYGQTACPLCRRPLFAALDWPILAAMKTIVASMAIQNALALLNAQYELRQGDVRQALIWTVALAVAGSIFWYVVVGLVLPNEEDWWRLAPGGLSLATTWGALVWSISVLGLKMWKDEGTIR